MAKFFAMTSKGLVDVLEQELKDMGLQKLERGISGVYFEGPRAHCYRANLRSRTATRIILPILDFPAYKNEDLYHNIQKHDFTKYIPANGKAIQARK
jgi:putative N6-adenine-specific DNA methylase